MENEEILKKYNNIYLEIITRYKGYIEEQEGLSVAALPKLVTPEDENVQVVSRGIKEKFPIYSYDDNFQEAARLSYEYIKTGITQIDLPFQFWLKPGETIRYGAGDKFDMVTLLCSLLLALGSSTAKAIVVTKELNSKFYTYFEMNGKFTVIDLDSGIKEYPSFEEIVVALGIEDVDEIGAYEFNDKLYNDLV
jgi:hypothetical protein